MLEIQLSKQPKWFKPLLHRSLKLKRLIGYDHWSREWEYPWAILSAAVEKNSLRILDVGGGGGSFAEYLAQNGHDCFVIDPLLNKGILSIINRDVTIYRKVRSIILFLILSLLCIKRLGAIPFESRKSSAKYYPYSAIDIKFPNNYFDRVFCLSVIEHIELNLWQRCIEEFERVLKPKGRLIITLDMGTPEANDKQYLKLVDSCSLKLIGNPTYETPITLENKQVRHPGHTFETIGLLWQK